MQDSFKVYAEAMSAITEMTNDALVTLATIAQPRSLAEGELFLKAGTQATQVGFVITGTLREFFITREGKEYNKDFIFAGGYTGSIYDLQSSELATATVKCLEATELLTFNYQKLEALAVHHPCIERTLRWAVQTLFYKKTRREYEFLTMDGYERYRSLLEQYPDIEAHVPQYHIASYLGITPVSLSRFKKKSE